MRLIFFFSFLMIGILNIDAQIKVQVNTDNVVLAETFEISFTVENEEGTFLEPDFGTFKKLSGPSISQRTSIINGKITKSSGQSFSIQARKVGKQKLPIIKFKTRAGKILSSGVKNITVQKSKSISSESLEAIEKNKSKDLFLDVEFKDSVFYVGQQIIADVVVYASVNVASYSLSSADVSIDGCNIERVRNFNEATNEINIKGKRFLRKPLLRLAIYPIQAGDYELGAIGYEFAISSGRGRYQRFIIKTDGVPFSVKALPNQPPNFAGAVGRYTVKSELVSKKNLSTDDVFAIRMTVEGDGDMKQLSIPEINFGDKMEVFDPQMYNEKQFENNGRVAFRKQFQYTIRPKSAGNYTLVPKFEYFDIDSLSFVTLSPDTFNIKVRQGKNAISSVLETNDEEQKMFPLIKKDNGSVNTTPIFKQSWSWILLSLPLFLSVGIFSYRKWKENQPEIDWEQRRFDEAEKMAHQKLQKANDFLKQQNYSSFFEELSTSIYDYLGDKFKMKPSELNVNLIKSELKSRGVEQSVSDDLIAVLQTSQRALFGGLLNEKSAKEAYQKAVSCISNLVKK